MKVTGKLKYKGSNDLAPFRMTRSEFVAMIDDERMMADVQWLAVDVCLTRWFFDCKSGWFHMPRVKYVPDKPEEWLLSHDEMLKKLKWSPKGFTQR